MINSPYDEITPVLSRDGTTLYFTRVGYPDFDRTLMLDSVDQSKLLPPNEYMALLAEAYTQINEGPVISPVASSFNQDTWIAYGDTADFNQVVHPGPPLNNALPNSVATITPDPNALYVINQYLPNGDMDRGFSLVRRTTDSLGWTFPEPITIKDYYTISSEVNLTMSFDGKVLICRQCGPIRGIWIYISASGKVPIFGVLRSIWATSSILHNEKPRPFWRKTT